jgi:ABC-2 type transport system ATP-binding protein
MSLLGFPVPAERKRALERVGLTQRAGDKVAAYSMGMRQRLGVASCLLGDPELLILDEPMNGLDPAGMHEMRAMIAGLAGEGRTVTLPAGASRELVADVNRRLVAVGVSVYGLQEVRASLEDWFLSVTTKLGERS